MSNLSKNKCIKFPSKYEEAKTLIMNGFSYNQVIKYSKIPFEQLSKIINEKEKEPLTKHGGHYLLTDEQIECYENDLGKRRGLLVKLTHGFADEQRNEQLIQISKKNKKNNVKKNK